MSRDLAQRILSLELAQLAHTDTELTIAAGANTGWLQYSPTAPFQAIIAFFVTFGDFPSNILQFKTRHKDYYIGEKVIGPDEFQFGTATWLYITDRNPAEYYITNNDSVSRVFSFSTWQLNVTTLQRLDVIKLMVWEMSAPRMFRLLSKYGMSPALPDLPNGMLDVYLRGDY